MPDEPEIVSADKRLRRWSVVAAVLLSLAALAVVSVLDGQFDEVDKLAGDNLELAIERMLRLTAIVAWVGGLGFTGTAVWFWRLSRQIGLSGRFPPPGMKVVRDTPVKTGSGARSIANLARMTALMCLLVGTLGMWYLYDLAVAALRQ